MDHSVLYGLVDHGDGAAEGLFGLLGVARFQALAQVAQRGPQTRRVRAVVFRAFGGLAGALHRRKMICHCACFEFLFREYFSSSTAELSILFACIRFSLGV